MQPHIEHKQQVSNGPIPECRIVSESIESTLIETLNICLMFAVETHPAGGGGKDWTLGVGLDRSQPRTSLESESNPNQTGRRAEKVRLEEYCRLAVAKIGLWALDFTRSHTQCRKIRMVGEV